MQHLLESTDSNIQDMRAFYNAVRVIPTSEVADVLLIRSHIAYHAGNKRASQASIRPSRAHSYRVALWGKHDRDDTIVRIVDYYDHRAGVVGLYLTDR